MNPTDYFGLFDLEPSWVLDTGVLHRRYLELQRHHHPDNYVSADEAERRRAAEQSMNLTEAHDVLIDAVARAGYMLGRAGVELQHEGTAQLSTGFLFAQLQAREEVADCVGAPDAGERLDGLAMRAGSDFDTCGLAFDSAMRREDLAIAEQQYYRLQFIHRLRLDINAARDTSCAL